MKAPKLTKRASAKAKAVAAEGSRAAAPEAKKNGFPTRLYVKGVVASFRR
jgi:hypothetical protein